MPFDESPSLNDFRRGTPDSSDIYTRRRRQMMLGGLLLLLLLVLATMNFLQSSLADELGGRGEVVGLIVDERGNPTQAEIYVIGTDLIASTSGEGVFSLPDVPAGVQKLAVVDDNGGVEYEVTVVAGDTVDIGQVALVNVTPQP